MNFSFGVRLHLDFHILNFPMVPVAQLGLFASY
jgi:hypothetical protein